MTSIPKEKVLDVIKPSGSLSRIIDGFEERKEQEEMLKKVIEAFNTDSCAVIEAGTGVGKSMAYLLPALAWAAETGERVLISTNTINLQEQLLKKDIPMAKKALDVEMQATLVKGMSNYLCLRKLEDAGYEKMMINDQEFEEF
jgi:ATP-dependent DNA helicase DinG